MKLSILSVYRMYSSSKKNFCTAVFTSQGLENWVHMLVLNLEFNFTYFHVLYFYIIRALEYWTNDIKLMICSYQLCYVDALLIIFYTWFYTTFQCYFIHMFYKYIFCQRLWHFTSYLVLLTLHSMQTYGKRCKQE